MKIVIATPLYPPEIGGPSTYTKLLETELPRHGFEVVVVPFGLVRHWPKGLRHLLYGWRLWRASLGAGIIYAQDPVSVGLPALVVVKLTRKKLLIRVPGDYAWEQSCQRFGVKENIDDFQNKTYGFRVELLRSCQRLTVSQADQIITPSRYFSRLVGGWIPNRTEKVETIYNGIDFRELPQSAEANSYQPKTIISAGRLVPWKGFEMLIKSLPVLSDWHLLIAGEGPDRLRLERLVKQLDLSNRVLFLGSMNRLDLLKKIKESEIFALNTSFESFSFQVVEAMCLGTPVITTNIGSLPEIINNNQSGILIKPNSQTEFVEAVINISTNAQLRQKLIGSAKQGAQQFSIENTLKQTARLIKNLSAVN